MNNHHDSAGQSCEQSACTFLPSTGSEEERSMPYLVFLRCFDSEPPQRTFRQDEQDWQDFQ